ncbi:MAG: Uncharacterized protein Athens101426_370 [Parcubacteria group bacterium Athens1014_26]|nr:MAG: Uncharacterized protein Athens101426_370 [Parcubacteria group bacterium Athens1014_26]
MNAVLGIGNIALRIISVSWWILLPLILFFVFIELRVWKKKVEFIKKIKWVLLEIKIPQEVLKTPKAMENVFSALHSIYVKNPDWEDVFFKGETLLWFSFEMVGNAGQVHFFARVPEINRNLIESAIYAEYPDAEINQAEDYTSLLPEVIPNDIYDLWGNDFILGKENPYPIKSYEYFETLTEERRLDPISAITEVMSRLKEDEMIWLQFLIKPVGDGWKKEGEDLRDKMMQREKKTKAGFFGELFDGLAVFIKNLFVAAVEHPTWPEKEKSSDKEKTGRLSPGETDVLKAVENKISKFGFETIIRFIYIDKQNSFTRANMAAIVGAFKQFSTQNMNTLKMDSNTTTYITSSKFTTRSWFRKKKLYSRKRKIFQLYRDRLFSGIGFPIHERKLTIFNTEELATVFHFPLTIVEAPKLHRVGTRKGEPPPGLPVE